MASDSVHPLRISRSNSTTSPSKMAHGTPRPLSEIAPTEKRRNSPSWNQIASTKKSSLVFDSSPFQPSPADLSAASPRSFWQTRNSENMPFGRSGSPSPTRRSSIERLQRASRVRNSNILALEQKQEYDPTRVPQIERPLSKVQDGSFLSSGSLAGGSSDSNLFRSDSKSSASTMSPIKSPLGKLSEGFGVTSPPTPSKDQNSPIKSSFSPNKFKSSFEQDSGLWSADSSFADTGLPIGRSLHRHAKSVTFDAAPPQINEYEMATPDISSIGTNSREGSYESLEDEYEESSILYDPAQIDIHEDSFDASLEDTDKTPVVGPEDWRGDSPSGIDHERSPVPDVAPSMVNSNQNPHQRTDSATSDHRPLPPLPGAGLTRSHSTSSNRGLNSAAERMLGAHRSLPSPPPAFTSKLDIQNIGNSKMSLEERLKLMMSSDDAGNNSNNSNSKTAAEQQRERRLRRGGPRDRFGSPGSEVDAVSVSVEEVSEMDDTIGDISALDDYQLPPRISRESIMRRVNGNQANGRESGYQFSSPVTSPHRSPTRSPERHLPLDPDVPIPSTEEPMLDEITEEREMEEEEEREHNEEEEEEEEEDGGSVIITRNHEEDDFEEEQEEEMSQIFDQSIVQADEEDEKVYAGVQDDSNYSETPVREKEEGRDGEGEEKKAPAEMVPTEATVSRSVTPVEAETQNSLPDFSSDSRPSDFSKGFESYMAPRMSELKNVPVLEPPRMPAAQEDIARPHTPDTPMSKPEYDGSGWGEPEDEFEEEPGTPESVIHHPVSEDEMEEEQDYHNDGDEAVFEEEMPREMPAIPERMATVKASGSKLKTRVSATPSDLAAMREARRQVSHEIPDVPPIPEKHQSRLSKDMTTEAGLAGDLAGEDFLERHPSFKNRSLTLDIDLGLSLDQDFERVIESQKRGYLMRQNTKLVAASDKDGDNNYLKTRSANNSPVKTGRPESWTVEPWNGKQRQSSQRRRPETGPVPPLPGQQSNAQALTQVEEEPSLDVAHDSGERGRLFVKVMGVKDLDLPVPKNERTYFSLTLDNGVHCVTTAWLEMARNAPIGQEFELVVPNDLEFQLTLNVKLDKPAPIRMTPAVKVNKPKPSAFSRVFGSPKKRKELELRQQKEDELAAQQSKQRTGPPTPYELLSPLVASDGSFARSYVCLKEHEHRCYGRPYMAEVSCFNEWATEEAAFASSVKSKRGNTAVVRRAPYKIAKLELQLLFVPRPKNITDEDMPKSMNSCIRELKAAEERLSQNWEGHLSQQGGDCPYWRRRYFKLVGTKLTAYHEATRQPRATINLSNAKRLIDDRRSLTEKETTGKGGRRRRSAFAEEEDGYMFVEEGFRIRFNNGELIDFYADTSEDKEGWMKVLSDVIGRGDAEEDGPGRSRSKWCELVLKREEQLRRRAEGRRSHSRTKSMYV